MAARMRSRTTTALVLGALLLLPAAVAHAGGGFVIDGTNTTATFQTDNGQPGTYQVMTLAQAITAMNCPDGAVATFPFEGDPNKGECGPFAGSGLATGVITFTTAAALACTDTIANKVSFNSSTYVEQNPLTAGGSCSAPPPRKEADLLVVMEVPNGRNPRHDDFGDAVYSTALEDVEQVVVHVTNRGTDSINSAVLEVGFAQGVGVHGPLPQGAVADSFGGFSLTLPLAAKASKDVKFAVTTSRVTAAGQDLKLKARGRVVDPTLVDGDSPEQTSEVYLEVLNPFAFIDRAAFKRGQIDLSGKASSPAAPRAASLQDQEIAKVQVAVVGLLGGAHAAAKSCLSLKRPKGGFKRSAAVGGTCAPAVWMNAKGTTKWSFATTKRLPKGSYVVYVRAVNKLGLATAHFDKSNRRAFKVK